MPPRAALLFLTTSFLFRLGIATAATPAADAAPPFQIERSHVHTLASRTLGRTYDIYVKLPPGYDKPENAQRKYPAIYLTDGPYTFQVASGVTRVPFSQGTFDEFILVGLSYAQGEDSAHSRERDLTPFADVRNKPYPTGGAGASGSMSLIVRDASIAGRVGPRRRPAARRATPATRPSQG